MHRDGSAMLIDYKTGQRTPSKKEVQVGFAPQLTLEAAMLQAEGAFGEPRMPARSVQATYLKLGGKDGGFVARDLTFDDDEPFIERRRRAILTGLKRLLTSFRAVETGLSLAPFPEICSPRITAISTIWPACGNGRLSADDEA